MNINKHSGKNTWQLIGPLLLTQGHRLGNHRPGDREEKWKEGLKQHLFTRMLLANCRGHVFTVHDAQHPLNTRNTHNLVSGTATKGLHMFPNTTILFENLWS